MVALLTLRLMTRRRFYAPIEAFSRDARSATLNADETRHLREVLRLKVGDEVYVFDGRGHEFRGQVQAIEKNSTLLTSVTAAEPASPESPLNLTLAVALLKGEKFDLVVQKATELGVASVVPVISTRADMRIRSDEEAEHKTIRWRRIALEATKQCGRARLMKMEAPITFAELMNHQQGSNEIHLMFAERDGTSFATAMDGVEQRSDTMIALVGSEGGWSDEEIIQARESGWKIVTLGGRTLRAETAAIITAALLQLRFGDLS